MLEGTALAISAPPDSAPDYPFLCVDAFLRDMVSARALASALETGLIDALAEGPRHPEQELASRLQMEPRGLSFLTDVLRASGVLATNDGAVALSPAFQRALAYRDLLEARLRFALMVLPDYHAHLTTLLREPGAFVEKARIFDLFRYDRCYEATPENLTRTRRWVQLTTVLTKYEAQALLAHHAFDGYRRMMDVGGNSGELSRRICAAAPSLQATVIDLPVVCAIGRENLAGTPEQDRVSFRPTDFRKEALPTGHDLVCFKSVLHDWPPADAAELIDKAAAALAPGGTFLIFERGPISVGDAPPIFAELPNLLFLYYLRSPESYVDRLRAAGLTDISIRRIDLEMPFHLVTARKPA